MKDPITTRTAHILAHSDRILIPLLDLYEALTGEGLMAWISPEMYAYLIATDETFDLIEDFRDLEMFNPLLRAELQVQGFWSGPLVMLHRWTARPASIMEDALMRVREMSIALETAWQTRAPDDPATEAELLNMLLVSDMLEREITGALHVYVETENADVYTVAGATAAQESF